MARHVDRYKYHTSLACLPALIAEIDTMKRKPNAAKRAEMLERYRKIEGQHHGRVTVMTACNMVNEYLLDVLWRTRVERKRQSEKRLGTS